MFRGRFLRHGAVLAVSSLVALAGPTIAQPGGKTVEIELSSFKFRPNIIQLEHGRDYVLHFVNTASGGHDFASPTFFNAAKVAPEDRAKLKRGSLELDGGEQASIHLTAPAAGHYAVRCSHFMHSTFGMTGEIVVS